MEAVEEAIANIDDTGRNCNIHIEVIGNGQAHGKDVLVKRWDRKMSLRTSRIKRKF